MVRPNLAPALGNAKCRDNARPLVRNARAACTIRVVCAPRLLQLTGGLEAPAPNRMRRHDMSRIDDPQPPGWFVTGFTVRE